MSHMLRSAVAAASLFACSACATTGSFDRNLSESSGPEATTALSPPTSVPSQASALRSVGAFPQAQMAASGQTPGSASAAEAGQASGQASGQAPITVHGTASLLAWEQSRGTSPLPPTSGFQNLMFEPSDSRLRIVLDMRDFGPGPGPVSRVALASNEEADASGALGGVASLWAEPPPAVPIEEVSDPDAPRDPLGGLVESPGPVITLPVIEPQATPEPGTLALAAFGLGMIGWRCRRIVRRMESST